MAEHLLRQGFFIKDRRLKLAGVEVDLLARDPDGVWYIVEVKSLSSWDWLPRRLTGRQRRRLQRAVTWWTGHCNQPTLLALAVVDEHDDIELFTDF